MVRREVLEAAAAVVAVAVAAVLLNLVRLEPLGLLLVPLATALLLPLGGTLAWRLLISTALVFAANPVLAFAVNSLGLPFTPAVSIGADLLPLAVLWRLGRLRLQPRPLADAGDLFAVAAGLLVLVVLARPAVGATGSQVLAILAGGEDNAAHLAIVNAIGIHLAYPAFHAAEMHLRMLDGNIAYPAAFHMNVAVLRAAVERTLGGTPAVRLVEVYLGAGVAVQAIWAATTVMTARGLAGRSGAALPATLAIAFGTVLLFAFGPPAATVRFGFQPQAAALWLLTFGLLAGVAEQLDGRPSTRLGLVVLATVGTAWCWYLVLPVMACLVGAVLFGWRTEYLGRRLRTLATLGAGVAASLPPVVLGLRAGAAAAINAGGGVYAVDAAFVAALVLGAALLALNRGFPNERARLVALVAVASALAFSGLLFAYQVRTSGAAGYYYQKSIYTLVMITAVVWGGTFLEAFTRLLSRPSVGPRRDLVLAALVIGSTWLLTAVVTPANPGRQYLSGATRYPDPALLARLEATGRPSDPRPAVVWHGNSLTVYDYYASRFAASFTLRESTGRTNLIASSIGGEATAELLAYVRSSPDGLRIVTRDPGLAGRLAEEGFTPADMARVTIDVVSGPADVGRGIPNVDISFRRVVGRLFGR